MDVKMTWIEHPEIRTHESHNSVVQGVRTGIRNYIDSLDTEHTLIYQGDFSGRRISLLSYREEHYLVDDRLGPRGFQNHPLVLKFSQPDTEDTHELYDEIAGLARRLEEELVKEIRSEKTTC